MRYKADLSNTITLSTGILQNVANENRQNVPPLPVGIDEEKLHFLIEVENIDHGPLNQNHDCRRHFIANFLLVCRIGLVVHG